MGDNPQGEPKQSAPTSFLPQKGGCFTLSLRTCCERC